MDFTSKDGPEVRSVRLNWKNLTLVKGGFGRYKDRCSFFSGLIVIKIVFYHKIAFPRERCVLLHERVLLAACWLPSQHTDGKLMSDSAGGDVWKRWENCCDHNSFLAYNIISSVVLLVDCTPLNHLWNWFVDFSCLQNIVSCWTADSYRRGVMWLNLVTVCSFIDFLC